MLKAFLLGLFLEVSLMGLYMVTVTSGVWTHGLEELLTMLIPYHPNY